MTKRSPHTTVSTQGEMMAHPTSTGGGGASGDRTSAAVITPSPDAEPAPDHHHPARPLPQVHDDATFERAAGFFRAAGEVARLRVLSYLLQREWCVTELATSLNEGLSTISQRLRVLRMDGLVSRRREGKHIYYALADDHVAHLVESALAHAAEHASLSSRAPGGIPPGHGDADR